MTLHQPNKHPIGDAQTSIIRQDVRSILRSTAAKLEDNIQSVLDELTLLQLHDLNFHHLTFQCCKFKYCKALL